MKLVNTFISGILLLLFVSGSLYSCDFFPLKFSNLWKYTAVLKNEGNRVKDVSGVILNKKDIGGKEYFYYTIPDLNVQYYVRCDDEKLLMKMIKFRFPVLGFLSADAYLEPEILSASFDMSKGQEIEGKSLAKAVIGFITVTAEFTIKIKMIDVYEEFIEKENRKVMHFEVTRTEENGNITVEDHWYASGIGYYKGETQDYRIILKSLEKREKVLQ